MVLKYVKKGFLSGKGAFCNLLTHLFINGIQIPRLLPSEFAQKHPTSTAHLSPIPSRDQPFIDTYLQENYITPGKSQNTLTKAKRAVTDYYTFLRQKSPETK